MRKGNVMFECLIGQFDEFEKQRMFYKWFIANNNFKTNFVAVMQFFGVY